MSKNMIEIPRSWFPDGENLRPCKNVVSGGRVVLYDVSDPSMIPDEKYVILSAKDAYEADALRTENVTLQHELEKAMLEKADLEKKLHAKTANGGTVAEVTRAGVCEIFGDSEKLLRVNDHRLVNELEKAVELLNPDCDHRGTFAARVTISVELLGDLEEKDEKDLQPD